MRTQREDVLSAGVMGFAQPSISAPAYFWYLVDHHVLAQEQLSLLSSSPRLQPTPEHPEQLAASGFWTVDHAETLNNTLEDWDMIAKAIDASGIERLDTAGALLLGRIARRAGIEARHIELKSDYRALFDSVMEADRQPLDQVVKSSALLDWFEGVGRSTLALIDQLKALLGFLGQTIATGVLILFHPRQWPLTSTVHHIQQTGLNALPLVFLLSFLVGAVVAFLGATVLKDFGAELFVVDLTTYAFLREFGVLLTAIIMAGRTASAFTAQIGTMKSREEIDAIRTIGLDPFVLLVLPRLMALLIALPILAMAAMVAGLLGGMMVSSLSLGIPSDLFIERMNATVELRHFLVGMVKAPLFALVIALVGCMEGFKVGGTAQSVGERTTSAVVQSIAMVIVIDAVSAVFFMADRLVSDVSRSVRGLVWNDLVPPDMHDGLDLDVPRGQIVGIVGGSGSGKSVLMRAILGLRPPQGGAIEVLDRPVTGIPDRDHHLRQSSGVLFQDGALFSSLTVRENIQVPLRERLRLDQRLMDELAGGQARARRPAGGCRRQAALGALRRHAQARRPRPRAGPRSRHRAAR